MCKRASERGKHNEQERVRERESETERDRQRARQRRELLFSSWQRGTREIGVGEWAGGL